MHGRKNIKLNCESNTKIKGKVKFKPKTGHEGPFEEQRYSSTLSLNSALDGVGV